MCPKHLCDKNTVKWHVHGNESFTSLRAEIFYHLFIKTSFIPPVEWDETQTSVFLCLSMMKILPAKLPWSLREGSTMSIWFSNTFKDQKYFKWDFNLSLNVFACPLPHQPSGLQYQCFHCHTGLPPGLVREVRKWNRVKTTLTYFVFRKKVVSVEHSGETLLVLFSLGRKSTIYLQSEGSSASHKSWNNQYLQVLVPLYSFGAYLQSNCISVSLLIFRAHGSLK